MKTLYHEGDSWLHRLSPRTKLIALALFSACLFLTRQPIVLSAAMLLAAAVLFGLGMGFAQTARRLRPVLLTIAFVTLFNLAFGAMDDAVVALLRLSALTFLAAAVTATVTIAQFMDEMTVAARPLEKAGLARACDIGLAVGLVIRFVPDIIERYRAIREAHRARGLPVRPLTLLVPLIILTLRDADNIAAAIDARGLRRHNNTRL